MHIGKRNLRVSVPDKNDGWIKLEDEERDLGVLMSKDFKFSKHCQLAKM